MSAVTISRAFTMRRYGPVGPAAAKHFTQSRSSGPPTQRAKVAQGSLGEVTSTITVGPIIRPSPTLAPETSRPETRDTQLLTEPARIKRAAEFVLSVIGVFLRADVERLQFAAVALAAGVNVGVQAELVHAHGVRDGALVDSGDAD